MLNFELSRDQLKMQKMAREFAREEIAPKCAEWNKREYFAYDLNERVAEMGFSGIMVPKEYGGSGQGVLVQEIVTEEFARIDDGVACALHMQGAIADCLAECGTEKQKRELFPGLVKGENPGFALTEPNAGSDAQGIETRAELKNGEWVINGTKMFITNSGLTTCKWIVVVCITDELENGAKEFTCILVPTDAPGFSVSEECIHKMGWNNVDNRELVFQDCRVPEENVIGKRGAGVSLALSGLDLGRIDFGALAVGMAQGAFDLAFDHAAKRVQSGKPISKFQAIQFKLADMKTQIELGRLMMYKAACLRDQHKPHTLEAAMTKLYTTDMAVKVIGEAVKLHGGYGLLLDSPISRFFRNIKIYTIGEGTNEIQRIVISRLIGC